jgi:hypothetical protein
LIQFLLTVVFLIEERVFNVEYVFREGNRYSHLVQQQLADKFPQTPVPYRNAVGRLIEKFRDTGSVLYVRGHHFQHILESAQRLSERTVFCSLHSSSISLLHLFRHGHLSHFGFSSRCFKNKEMMDKRGRGGARE